MISVFSTSGSDVHVSVEHFTQMSLNRYSYVIQVHVITDSCHHQVKCHEPWGSVDVGHNYSYDQMTDPVICILFAGKLYTPSDFCSPVLVLIFFYFLSSCFNDLIFGLKILFTKCDYSVITSGIVTLIK